MSRFIWPTIFCLKLVTHVATMARVLKEVSSERNSEWSTLGYLSLMGNTTTCTKALEAHNEVSYQQVDMIFAIRIVFSQALLHPTLCA